MDSFNNASEIILDLIFLNLNEEDLHETLRVSKSWFWASIRRTKKLKITSLCNPLKSMAEFYNNHRSPCEEELDWLALFEHLVLDELVVIGDKETTNYLVNNGCNTAGLTIEISKEEPPLTLASLRTFTRLQYLEYGTNRDNEWHPIIVECLKSSNFEFDTCFDCTIAAIKLNSSAWHSEDPVLKSVTKLSLLSVTIDFLRDVVELCSNLEELHCFDGVITQSWRKVFPPNVKRIELHNFRVFSEVAPVVDASTDSGRNLLPYLCQRWKSVEKFHFDGFINVIQQTVYEAFPQQREEKFMCNFVNEAVNLGSPLFQSREIHVEWSIWNTLQFIPSTKSVKIGCYVRHDLKFSPRDVCMEPGKVEDLALTISYTRGFTPIPFGPSSFEGFVRLTSLALNHISALAIKMVLDQCPSIKKLKLKELKAFTFEDIPSGSSYANLIELLLEKCEEPMDKVFQVFPNLTDFKQSAVVEIQEARKQKIDWLCQHLISNYKRCGLVFERRDEIRYTVSDDLQVSLSQAQKLLKEFRDSECYLKGFKLIPRVETQKVIYIK